MILHRNYNFVDYLIKTTNNVKTGFVKYNYSIYVIPMRWLSLIQGLLNSYFCHQKPSRLDQLLWPFNVSDRRTTKYFDGKKFFTWENKKLNNKQNSHQQKSYFKIQNKIEITSHKICYINTCYERLGCF